VARVIAAKYPELKVYLTQDGGLEREISPDMFDAMDLGMMATMVG